MFKFLKKVSFVYMADTLFSGHVNDKLWLLSGQFSLTIKDSESVSGINLEVTGLSWDGTDTLWTGAFGVDDKLYLQSGKFTSTLKDSEDVNAIDISPQDISSDDNNAPWIGVEAQKLYLQSGKFTSTIKDSEGIGLVDVAPRGISWDGTNTPWCGQGSDKLYLQSGQFTSIIKDSESIVAIDITCTAISWDGINTPWVGDWEDKLYLQSGQFTSTLKDSISVNTLDSVPTGIDTGDYSLRIGFTRTVIDTLTITDQVSPTIIRVPFPIQAITDIFTISDSVLGYIDYIPVIDILTITDIIAVIVNSIDVIDYFVITDTVNVPTISTKSVTDTLIISDLFTIDRNVNVVTQTLNIQQYVDLNDIIERTASSNLIISDTVTVDTSTRSFKITDNLTITDNLIATVPRTFIVEDTLVLNNVLGGVFQYNINIEDEFDILYIDTENLIIYRIMDTVERHYTANRKPWNFLTIQQNVQVTLEKTGAISKSVTDTLTITDEATVARSLVDSFTISDVIAVTQGKLIKTALVITDAIGIIKTKNQQLTDALVLKCTVGFTHTKSHTHHEYAPSIGTTTDPNAPTPPSLTEPTITTYLNVQLSYPLITPTHILTLRGPELGNQDQLGFTRVNRETRGGTLIIFSDADWPKREQLNLQFIGLSESESQDVLDFLRDTLGKQIKLRDWEGVEHTVITLTPDNPITRDGYCQNAIDLNFESAI